MKIVVEDLTPDGRLKQQYLDVVRYFDCALTELTSLVGVPVKVGSNFYCNGSSIISLTGAPMIVQKDVYCQHTKITSLQGIGKDYLQEIGRTLFLSDCTNLKSQLLGIMRVKKLKQIIFNSNKEVEDIFNRHLEGDRNLLDCKEELMNKGFKEFARL